MVRVAMWSGPRNISTAMMRAWENRTDTVVEDEPLYGPYLATTGSAHPLSAEVISDQGRSWSDAVARLRRPLPPNATIQFQKHMTHHLTPDIDRAWIAELTNAFLIRDPAAVVASYSDRREEVTGDDLGFRVQAELFEWITNSTGTRPPVLDAADVAADPEGSLRALCSEIGVPFSDRMLTWPAGKRASDGVWAPHWYRNVEASTGWVRTIPGQAKPAVADHLGAVVAECLPYYEQLAAYRICP